MVFQGDEAQVEACFGPFEHSANRKIGARFASNIPLAQKSFWTHSMERLCDVGLLDSRFFLFGDIISVHAR